MTPRVAIVSSGLGHVHRGIETWAATVAEVLHKSGGNVILFGSGPRPDARSPYVRVPCLRRDGWIRRFVSWDKAYLYEQISFARNLRRHLRSDRFDIVHAADPNVAQQLISHCAKQNLALVYQDALAIGPVWCSKFKHVQALAPYYKDSAKTDTSSWRVIPHFIDTKIFTPAPQNRAPLQIIAVGDFSPVAKKRLDWVVSEYSAANSELQLLLVGSATQLDLDRIRIEAERMPGRVQIRTNVPHKEMPDLYRSADIFVHAATNEPFGIVLIEAMASGLPIIAHSYPVTEWIVGEGGEIIDMTKAGDLAAAIDKLAANEDLRRERANKALARVRTTFDRNLILPLYHEWHQDLARRRDRT